MRYYDYDYRTRQVYAAYLTHGLAAMADAAGLYEYLWAPGRLNVTTARDLIEPLRDGLGRLENGKLDRFKPPQERRGDRRVLIDFVADYLAACEDYPMADLEANADTIAEAV